MGLSAMSWEKCVRSLMSNFIRSLVDDNDEDDDNDDDGNGNEDKEELVCVPLFTPTPLEIAG